MSRLFYHVMQDNVGNLLFDVSGTMRLAGTGTAATIYGDEALTIPIANPMTNHPSFGSFKCFLGAGDYDFYMAKAGYTFETLTGVQGLGTMAQQNASAVAITGGSAVGLTQVSAGRLNVAGSGADLYQAYIAFDKTLRVGLGFQQQVDDAGGNASILFLNTAGTGVGWITANATTTTYATASDARLKHAVTALTGALDVVRSLRPVTFRWKSTDEIAEGFLGHELQQVVPNAVTGQPDAVNEDGSINPLQVDYSKLVPILTAAVKELLARVEVLEQALA